MNLIIYILTISIFGAVFYNYRFQYKNNNDSISIMSFILMIYVFIALYILNVIICYQYSEKTELSKFDYVSLCWSILLISLELVYCAVSIVHCWNVINENMDRNAPLLFLALFVCLILSIASIYYLLFTIKPKWFEINDVVSGNVFSLAFEFVYFTITSAVSYSGEGIELVGVLPKIVHLMYILFFYLFAGKIIVSLVGKSKVEKSPD